MALPWSDNFNRADGAIGADWTVQTGVWNVKTNEAECGTDNENIATADNVASTADVQVDIKVSTNKHVGAVGRFAVGSDCYIAWGADNGKVYIYRFDDSGQTELAASAGVEVAVGDTLTLICVDTDIKLLVNGSEKLSTTDSTYTTGLVGIFGWGAGTKKYLDDFAADEYSTPVGGQMDTNTKFWGS